MRLIPARAGKTRACEKPEPKRQAHPRSRGENAGMTHKQIAAAGSSPLARGKPSSTRTRTPIIGLIPARAGKTRCALPPGRRRPAHPRSRGENANGARPGGVAGGSSPLARGKHPGRPSSKLGDQLIPARAGKTRGRSTTPSRTPAHPRSRGENGPGRVGAAGGRGSSPLARGKPVARALLHRPQWLIPARAGKTSFPHRLDRRQRAHPRSRGENLNLVMIDEAWAGSSPLARGKQETLTDHPEDPRLIPARAGKTEAHVLVPWEVRAHPRSRGENPPCSSAQTSLVWLIPARAGKTRRE